MVPPIFDAIKSEHIVEDSTKLFIYFEESLQGAHSDVILVADIIVSDPFQKHLFFYFWTNHILSFFKGLSHLISFNKFEKVTQDIRLRVSSFL